MDDIGEIFRATVYDLLEGGQVTEAMDVAKQGFSRLQKIKTPLEGAARSSSYYKGEPDIGWSMQNVSTGNPSVTDKFKPVSVNGISVPF